MVCLGFFKSCVYKLWITSFKKKIILLICLKIIKNKILIFVTSMSHVTGTKKKNIDANTEKT